MGQIDDLQLHEELIVHLDYTGNGRRIPNIDKWELKVRNPDHNHTTNDNMIGHPIARRFKDAARYHEDFRPRAI